MKVKLTQRRTIYQDVDFDEEVIENIRTCFLSDLPYEAFDKKFSVERFEIVDDPYSFKLNTHLEIELRELV